MALLHFFGSFSLITFNAHCVGADEYSLFATCTPLNVNQTNERHLLHCATLRYRQKFIP